MIMLTSKSLFLGSGQYKLGVLLLFCVHGAWALMMIFL